MAEQLLCPGATSNVADEQEYKVRVTFGAGTVSTWRALGVTVTRPTATTLVFAFAGPYTEVSTFSQSWQKATGASSLQYQITTNNIAVNGTVTLTSVATNTAGTATAPANGDVVYIVMGVARSVLNDRYTGATA